MFFETAGDFARWLGRHHRGATELLVGFHKVSSAHPSLTWPESVDVALCLSQAVILVVHSCFRQWAATTGFLVLVAFQVDLARN